MQREISRIKHAGLIEMRWTILIVILKYLSHVIHTSNIVELSKHTV